MKTLLIIALLSSLTYAQDFDTFVGVQGGYSNVDVDPKQKINGVGGGLRIGFVQDVGRVYAVINTSTLDNASINTIDLNFDAITPRPFRFNDSFAIRGLVGFHGGYTQITPDTLSNSGAPMIGAKAGILFDFPADISVELTYKASWHNIDDASFTSYHSQTAYAALDYTF